jgi:thioredoxin-like negative regulator of GroEL
MIERLLAGEAALSRGELDAAERLFTQVAQADPRNAIAVVGRARVAFARGSTDDARTFADQALAIDPEEVAAHWLIRELDGATAATTVPAAATAHAPTPSVAPVVVPAGAKTASGPRRRSGWRGWLDRLLRRA